MFRKGLKICFHGWVPGWLAVAIETKAISASNKVEVEAELGKNNLSIFLFSKRNFHKCRIWVLTMNASGQN